MNQPPVFNGLVRATNPGIGSSEPPEAHDLHLSPEGVLRHESGAYIRFSKEGDIFIVPASGRTIVVGSDDLGK